MASADSPPPLRAVPDPPDLSEAWDGVERRRGGDRREQAYRWSDAFRFRRRASGGRRQQDQARSYVDAYTRTDLMLLLAIFALNIADAFFTLEWLSRGGSEGNPLMQHLLDIGTEVFLFQKIGVAGFWLLLLTAHKNFRVARIGMWSLLAVYGCLLLYHLLLFFFGEPIPAPPVPL